MIYSIFITLTKWKLKPTKEHQAVQQFSQTLKELEKQGIKMQVYWTLGRYDAVTITEAPSEKDVMKILLPLVDVVDTETLVAIPREDAIKLL
ncbi:MAG: GYD domain-containing protein [Candidatus Bathyarchaeota archaeon]|nr:GYD domain-containing protein [Candidatus Bathyarchaeota archaeon]